MSTNKTIIAAGCLLMGGMLMAMSEKDGTLVPVTAETSSAIFRISEVEVHPEYVDSYLPFASEVAAASVKTEPGVISIFPMQDKKNTCQFRIVEIYADDEAYKAHIASAHFQKYKKGTLHMVKRLALLDHDALVPELKDLIFKK